MIIQLFKDNVPVFTARSAHTVNNAGHDLPIIYEGDLSLYPNRCDEAPVSLLEGILSEIAYEHGLKLDGDYHEMINNVELMWKDGNGDGTS